MKSKLTVLSLAVLLFLSYSSYVQAHEGQEHKMANGTVMNDNDMPKGHKEAKSAKAVEVGNKFCPVTGDKVPAPGEKGTMGDEPVKYEYNGKIYNLCCKMCVKDFKKNPGKYSAIAEKEINRKK